MFDDQHSALSPRKGATRTAANELARGDRQRRILVVDDDEWIRDLLQALLRPCGYAVQTAPDAFGALWYLRQQRADLLITDIEMPVCGGIELARRARESWPQLPILFITGGCADVGEIGTQDETPWALLRKPFSAAVLMDQVESLLSTVPAETRNAADPLAARRARDGRVRRDSRVARLGRSPGPAARACVLGAYPVPCKPRWNKME